MHAKSYGYLISYQKMFEYKQPKQVVKKGIDMFARFNLHFWQITWQLKSVFMSLIMMIVVGAILIATTEAIPFNDALYFAFVTGSTVGYGDIVPISAAGRIVSIVLAFIGILFTGLVVAVAVRALEQAWADLHGTG